MLFFSSEKEINIWKFILIVLLAACTVLFGAFSSKLSDDNTKRSKSTLERALTRSITQCYALEGTYPPDINYLTDHYGLTYQRLLLHRLSIHRLQSASRCDNNREEITHVQAKIKITSG